MFCCLLHPNSPKPTVAILAQVQNQSTITCRPQREMVNHCKAWMPDLTELQDPDSTVAILRQELANAHKELAQYREKLKEVLNENERLNRDLYKMSQCWWQIRVPSPLTDIYFNGCKVHYDADAYRKWESWCPVCKRPLDTTVFGSQGHGQPERPLDATRHHRYAYVTTLWGTGIKFSLAALVLGQALSNVSKHARVLLHTNTVPPTCLQVLSKLWELKLVDHIEPSEGLFSTGKTGSRFTGVFNKLHALNLVNFDKVLLLDIDLTVLGCPDPLFNLDAPAALWRGQGQDIPHGCKISGRCFFGGPKDDWQQTNGINAGVVLLEPNARNFAFCKEEVTSPMHPERIAGSGPEQDVLSRFFAAYWTHISVDYNFQIHHLWFALVNSVKHFTGTWETTSEEKRSELINNPCVQVVNQSDGPKEEDVRKVTRWTRVAYNQDAKPVYQQWDARKSVTDAGAASPETSTMTKAGLWVPPRISRKLNDIHIIHFSGEVKFWDLNMEANGLDNNVVDYFLRSTSYKEVRLWIDRQGDDESYAKFGIRCEDGNFNAIDEKLSSDSLEEIVHQGIDQIRGVCLIALQKWQTDLTIAMKTADVSSIAELKKILTDPNSNEDNKLKLGDRVVVQWWENNKNAWYPATVECITDDGFVRVHFDDQFGWNESCYFLKQFVEPLPNQ